VRPFCALYFYTGFLFRAGADDIEFISRTAQTNAHQAPRAGAEDRFMLDTLMIAAGCGFFLIAVLYVLACDRM
jgi:hypothetical protein